MEKIKDTFDWFHNEKGDITLTHNEEPFAFVNTEKVAKAVIGKFLEFLTPSQPPPLATDNTLPSQTARDIFKKHSDEAMGEFCPDADFDALLTDGSDEGKLFRAVLKAMQEYAQISTLQAREKAIQECIETLKMDIEISVGIDRAIEILRKLKK